MNTDSYATLTYFHSTNQQLCKYTILLAKEFRHWQTLPDMLYSDAPDTNVTIQI